MDPMKKARKTGLKKAQGGTPLTEEKFKYYFEQIKELISSTVKGSEKSLKKEIRAVAERVDRTEIAILEHSRLLKGQDVRFVNLENRMDGLETRFDGLETKVDLMRVELKGDMLQMEQRLSVKIDNTTKRPDDHEARIKKLERVA
ncbi:MAG TPA: hypothetical protein PLY45_04600 [bacterium]|nr:hypothetical protein [bacterium]